MNVGFLNHQQYLKQRVPSYRSPETSISIFFSRDLKVKMPLSHPKRPAKISKNHCLYKSEPGGSKFLLEKQTKTKHSRFHNWDHNGPHCYGVHSWSPNDGEKIILISHDFTIKRTDVCATCWCILWQETEGGQ